MRLILCWLGIWIFCVGLFAQNTKDNSSYLFDEFQDCLIVYKDGRQFTAPVNYDLIKKHYVFKDPEQQEKEFSDPELIAVYNPQIQISAESETKRSIFREKDKTKRSKKESAQHSKSRNKSFVMTSVSAL